MAQSGYGLMFHHFHRPGARFGQGSITADEFARLLDFIGRGRLLPAAEWYRRAVEGKLRADDVCVTFDDNLLCQYEIAVPVLESLGLTAFFFVYSSVCRGNIENLEVYHAFRSEHFESIPEFYVAFERAADERLPALGLSQRLHEFRPDEYLQGFAFYTPEDRRFRYLRDDVLGPERYAAVMDGMIAERGLNKEGLAKGLWMDDELLRRLAANEHMIGLHSDTHPTRLARLSRAEQVGEYRRNYEHLAAATGTAPVTMAHPCNSYGAETLEILEDLGIRVGFRSNMAAVENRGPLEFPRKDHADVLREMEA